MRPINFIILQLELTGIRASFFKVLTLGSETLVTFDLTKGEHWATGVRWWGDGGR